MPDRSKMRSYLMRSAGFKLNLHKAVTVKVFERFVACNNCFAAFMRSVENLYLFRIFVL